ncbi:MAG: P-II family nitrogen regulator [Lachnospiraceae bacterium]|nr:P-II family nitrogen regulator [Lachnospiraceae bacterium]
MSDLYLMATIMDRKFVRKFTSFYNEIGLPVSMTTLGTGTASSQVLDYFGLDGSERGIMFHFVTKAKWKSVKRQLQLQMKIDLPGIGIAFIVPISSIGGKRALEFLTCGQEFVKGDESSLKGTKYELLVAIANQGYMEQVMDAARKVHAAGGTVIHAKGTGGDHAEKFLGVSLVPEKEMVFIVAKTEHKKAIMESIMKEAGLNTEAKTIVFSLPVTDTAGMRLLDEFEIDEELDGV